jgi:putative hydrolase of HD superfamily
VEIDAGDTYTYDTAGLATQAEREQQAAARLFGMLPTDQGLELRALWEEFESRATPESRFARTLDTLMPQLHNYHSQGKAWQENGVSSEQVHARGLSMRNGSTTLWEYARALVDDAVARGYLAAPHDDKMAR